jgi:hypothetical protein
MSYSIDPNDVKDDLLPEGSYVVRIRGCGYGTTKGKGTPYQRIKGLIMAGPIDKLTDVNDAQPRSESLNCDLWLTEGCRTQNARALAACAVTGPVDLANNDATHTALVGATVVWVLKHEEYNGNVSAKVAFWNRPADAVLRAFADERTPKAKPLTDDTLPF